MRKFSELNKMQSIILLYNSYMDDGANVDTAFKVTMDDKDPIDTLKAIYGYTDETVVIDSQLMVD